MYFKNIILIFFLSSLYGCREELDFTLPSANFDNGGLILPQGFGALVVADSIGHARHLTVNSNGDIYVKLGITGGTLGNVALRDTNRDGKADIIVRFGDYPNDGKFATEMKIHKGYLYYSSELVVYRQKLTPPKLVPDSKPEVLMIDHHPVQWHNAKSLAFDDKGGMYVTFSAPTNVCEDWTSTVGESSANMLGQYPCQELIEHAGIWKFDDSKPAQSQATAKKYATGLRSIVAMTWNDKEKSLYAVQHGRDYLYGHAPQYYTPWMNATLPAEEFMKIKSGENYGWPYTYYDHFKNKRMLAPEYGGDGVKEEKKFALPLLGLPAHWAPNDLLFYKGKQFPSRYKDGAFVAFHGSTNRAPYPQAGYIVAFLPFQDGKPTGVWEVFADGFVGKDTIAKMEEALYRPVGLAEGPDGSLYVSDSKKGKIWRIMYKGNAADFGTSQLANMEKRKMLTHLRTPDEIKDNLSLKGKLDGAQIYASHCSTCHQKNGEGQDTRYPPLADSEWVSGKHEILIQSILSGQDGEIKVKGNTYNQIMPSYKFLSDAQLAEVINYIKNNFGNKGGKVTPSEIALIRKTNGANTKN